MILAARKHQHMAWIRSMCFPKGKLWIYFTISCDLQESITFCLALNKLREVNKSGISWRNGLTATARVMEERPTCRLDSNDRSIHIAGDNKIARINLNSFCGLKDA